MREGREWGYLCGSYQPVLCGAPQQDQPRAFSTGRGTPTTFKILEAWAAKVTPIPPGCRTGVTTKTTTTGMLGCGVSVQPFPACHGSRSLSWINSAVAGSRPVFTHLYQRFTHTRTSSVTRENFEHGRAHRHQPQIRSAEKPMTNRKLFFTL